MDMAKALKQQHAEDYPDYQYTPRKPSEKKRRATRRKAVALGLSSESGRDSTVSENTADTAEVEMVDTMVTAEATATSSSEDSQMTRDQLNTNAAFVHPSAIIIGDQFLDENAPSGWSQIDNNLFSAEIDLNADDQALYDLIKEFNDSDGFSGGDQTGSNAPVDTFIMRPSERAQYDEDLFNSLLNWNDVEDQIAQLKNASANNTGPITFG